VASTPTTLSSATGTTLALRPARSRRSAVYVGLGVMAAGGVIVIAATGGGSDAARSEAAPAPAVAPSAPAVPPPAPAPAVAVPAEPPPASAPRAAAPNAEVSARTKDVLTRFVAWSRKHEGAPCPAITELDGAPRDPWGHAFRLTCTEQPDDQIIGAISAGPDGAPGTADDIASWQLGREVTDSVRGARWVAAAPPPSKPLRSERGLAAGTKRGPGTSGAQPAETKPVAGAKPKQTKPGKKIELDENGLPINR
jgi:hypothetical protein